MSEFKVCITKVVDVRKHENADSLDIVTVYGFQVVAKKDSYKIGDRVFYIPIDSVLPQDLEDTLFPPDAKIKLNNHRVRQIRIRQFPSQGMLVSLDDMLVAKKALKFKLTDETDFAEKLGITKYEPPVPEYQGSNKKKMPRFLTNSNFDKYNGIDNIKWNPNAFEGHRVVVQEKLHGSNCRIGYVPTEANTLWKKIKKLFGQLPRYEIVHGSNNQELTNRSGFDSYYGRDIYKEVLVKVGAFEKIRPNEILYGELIGEGVQKNYTYGHKGHHFVLFDVKVRDAITEKMVWLDPDQVKEYAEERGFDMVPVLYEGPYFKDVIEEHVSGPSVYDPKTPVREGIVVKSVDKYHNPYFSSSKMVLKHLNPKYLDKEQSDFH